MNKLKYKTLHLDNIQYMNKSWLTELAKAFPTKCEKCGNTENLKMYFAEPDNMRWRIYTSCFAQCIKCYHIHLVETDKLLNKL